MDTKRIVNPQRRKTLLLSLAGFIIVFGITVLTFAQIPAPKSSDRAPQEKPSVEATVATDRSIASPTLDIVYAQVDKTPLRMDAYLVPGSQNPAVVFFAGGDGSHKSRGENDAKLLNVQGISVFAVNTTPVGMQSEYMGYLQNAKAAVRFIRAHASDYGIDPESIFALGTSFGGTTAALLGTTAGMEGDFEGSVGENLDVSSRVSGSIVLFASVYFNQVDGNIAMEEKIEKAFMILFDCNDPSNCPGAEWLKPAQYASLGDPPFLIIHGTADNTATPVQAQMFYDALQAQSIESTLLWAEGFGHDPALVEEYIPSIVSFIESH